MPCGREIRLRRVKSLRRWGFISFHLMRSIKYHNLQSKLFHRERSERFHFLFGQDALNIGRGACQGSEHRATCGRWSGALSRKKQRALRSAPSEQGDYVSDRKGRWFESNRGSHLRSLEPQRVQGFFHVLKQFRKPKRLTLCLTLFNVFFRHDYLKLFLI